MQKFKIFVGFRNRVCCNMCVSTDGLLDDIKVSNHWELQNITEHLLLKYESAETLAMYSNWARNRISEKQFSEFIGRCKLIGVMPKEEKQNMPEMLFTDHHLNQICEGYYYDKNFCRYADGSIDLWRLYNLFTSANKSSYIDKFLERGLNSEGIVKNLMEFLS